MFILLVKLLNKLLSVKINTISALLSRKRFMKSKFSTKFFNRFHTSKLWRFLSHTHIGHFSANHRRVQKINLSLPCAHSIKGIKLCICCWYLSGAIARARKFCSITITKPINCWPRFARILCDMLNLQKIYASRLKHAAADVAVAARQKHIRAHTHWHNAPSSKLTHAAHQKTFKCLHPKKALLLYYYSRSQKTILNHRDIRYGKKFTMMKNRIHLLNQSSA